MGHDTTFRSFYDLVLLKSFARAATEECLLFSGHLLAVGKVCYNACYYSWHPKEAYSLVAMNARQCSLA